MESGVVQTATTNTPTTKNIIAGPRSAKRFLFSLGIISVVGPRKDLLEAPRNPDSGMDFQRKRYSEGPSYLGSQIPKWVFSRRIRCGGAFTSGYSVPIAVQTAPLKTNQLVHRIFRAPQD